MNARDLKKNLVPVRPGLPEAADPDVQEALQAAERDPALREWARQHFAFQDEIRNCLQSIQPPPNLEQAILLRSRTVKLRRAVPLLALAASLFILVSLSLVQWQKRREPEAFDNFQSRVARMVLREYRMDIFTPDEQEIRRFLEAEQAPSGFVLPRALDATPRLGAGRFSWHGHPVAMVCFDLPEDEVLFLFVIGREAVKAAPSAVPEIGKVHTLNTARWAGGDYLFVLAGTRDLQPFL